MSFNKLGLSSWLVKQCATLGIKDPTPIQENCIPNILSGKDCIGAAKTGSGKTLAFALPILQKLSEDPYGIFALVLTPTRELACQIADQFAVIGKPVNLKVCTVIGGVDMVEQGIALSKRPHIVVATPGRLVDHLESCDTFTLMKLRFLVLDEADRLLGGHYDEQIKAIFKRVPKEKQCLFFSATITDTLQKLKGFLKKDVFSYEAPLENASLTVQSLQQHYVLCPEYVRDAYLVQTLRQLPQKSTTIIFTNTCRKCQILSMMLDEVGFENVALHGMMPQNQRSATLAKFRSNTVKILVTTDVASRGLDIPHVEVVINHCMPNIAKEYVHRVGRTARAGKGGTAISILGPGDLDTLKNVEEFIGVKLSEFKVDDSEVGKIFTQISVTESEAHLTLEEKDFYEKRRINRRKKWILEGLDPDEEEEKLMKKRKDKKRKRKNNKREVDNKIQKKRKKMIALFANIFFIIFLSQLLLLLMVVLRRCFF